MQTPIMEWNTAKKIWQHSTDAHLFVLWEPFLGTWPIAGIMQNGQVFELPTPAHPTTDSGFLSLPTPLTTEHKANASPGALRRKTHQLTTVVHSLPTPTTRDYKDGTATGEVAEGNPKHRLKVEVELLPTTRTSMANGPTQKEIAAGNPKSRIEVEVELGATNWGKFEPAIRRWEEVLGRPAPAPTKPDGKDGAHRLSSAFTEFMMGLEPGWITDVGLTRNEELKACGNGVVPQQAELALRILLEGVALPKAGGGMTMFPTPTVSDTFTDNLASTQQKEGSMHSVTLPQAVRMVSGTIEAGQELSTLDPQTDNHSIGSLKFTAEDRQ